MTISVGVPPGPLSYTGEKVSVIPLKVFNHQPTTSDKKYRVGQFAILGANPTTGVQGEIWYLSYFSGGNPVWSQLSTGAGVLEEFVVSSGTSPVGPDSSGQITYTDGNGVGMTGGTNAITFDMVSPFTGDFTFATSTVSITKAASGQWLGFNDGTDAFGYYNNAGTPEGVVTASIGSWCSDTTNGEIYVKQTGDATNTGWALLDSSAQPDFPWVEVTDAGPTAMVVNQGVIANNAIANVDLTLPSTAAVGSIVRVSGKGAGGFQIQQNAGQTVHFAGSDTTTGVGGSTTSTITYNAIELLCTTANTDFVVLSSVGSFTIV